LLYIVGAGFGPYRRKGVRKGEGQGITGPAPEPRSRAGIFRVRALFPWKILLGNSDVG